MDRDLSVCFSCDCVRVRVCRSLSFDRPPVRKWDGSQHAFYLLVYCRSRRHVCIVVYIHVYIGCLCTYMHT
jgi:hypothetical protein